MIETVPESRAEKRMRLSLTRWFVRYPLIAGTVLLAAAVAWTWAGDDLGFWSFLLMLLGGWSLAFAFVNVTTEMRPVRHGVVLHVGVAVVLTALMLFVFEYGGDVRSRLPEPVRAVVVVLQIAAAPAAGWIWLGVLSRITDLFGRRDAKKRTPPTAPQWEQDESGDGSCIEFAAIELRMSTLTAAIVCIVGVVGLAGTLVLIAFDDVVMQLGARIAIILTGVVVGLPAYGALRGVLRRRARSCALAFGNDELRLRVG